MKSSSYRHIFRSMGLALMCMSLFSLCAHAQDGPPSDFPEEYNDLIKNPKKNMDPPVQKTTAEAIIESIIPYEPSTEDNIRLLCDYIRKKGYPSEDGSYFYLYDIHTVPAEILLEYLPDKEILKYLSGKRISHNDGTETVQACSITYHMENGKADPVGCIYHTVDEENTVYYASSFRMLIYQPICMLNFKDIQGNKPDEHLNDQLNSVLQESLQDLNSWLINTSGETKVLCLRELGFDRCTDDSIEQFCSFVDHAYHSCFERSPDRSGYIYWSTSLYAEYISPADLLSTFLQSPEFLMRNLDHNEFIYTLYSAFLDREPDSESLSEWVYMLDNGVTRKDIIDGFAQSTEFHELLKEKHKYK